MKVMCKGCFFKNTKLTDLTKTWMRSYRIRKKEVLLMRLATFLITACFLTSVEPCFSTEWQIGPSAIWREAYEGNFSLVQKMTLPKTETSNLDDDILRCLALAYTYHRLGWEISVHQMFHVIDDMIEMQLMSD